MYTLLFLVAILGSASAQTCNAHGFYCSAPDKYQLCIDGAAPSFEATCEAGTSCFMDCAIECSSKSCARCNSAGYYCLDDTQFQTCPDGTNHPDPDTEECPPGSGTVCSKNCNSPAICTPHTCPATCTETTRLPVPDNTTAYYLCEVDSRGEVTISSHVCPAGTEYNDVGKRCSRSTTTTTTSTTPSTTTTPEPTTTTPRPLVCTATGRYANPANCSKYHLCLVGAGGGFTKYDYDCAPGSFFHVVTARCTNDPAVCGSTPRMLAANSAAPVCLSDDTRYEDSNSCSHYFICSWWDGELISFRHACPADTVFNPDTAQCTGRDNYYCYDN